ncbi:MAG: hypothetical protein IJT21_10190 [Synergistaceae bacterium]|nr:hypothetical protein [Synergistaceae bacterium]
MPASINIDFDTGALVRAGVLLNTAPEKIKIAVSHAVNRSLESFKTASLRETAKKYFVKQKDLRDSITVKKSYGGEMNGAVISRGTRKPLSEYQLSPRKNPAKPGSVRGAVKRAGGLKPIPPAFLFARGGNIYAAIRDPTRIRTLMSPSVPQLIKNKETVAEGEKKARETFTQRLEHELKRAGVLL